MPFCGYPQKHKTRFIISYTAQNRLHSVLLKTCSHSSRPDRAPRPPACSPPWLELPGAAERIAAWSEISGLDLARLGTTATAEEITDTAVTQPLVVAATLLAHEELTKRGLLSGADAVVAGHSVGEIAAYAIAGVISADDAVKLAATRGAEMAKACALEPTGMSAVLGGDEAEVLGRLEALDLVPANRNAAGQIVAAGAVAALDKLAEDPPAKARVRQLATAGAFHTQLHGVGAGRLRERRRKGDNGGFLSRPRSCCRTPTANRSPRPPMPWTKLVAQLTRPVRWDLCTATMRQENVTAIVEFPPAGTLTGIAKRELRGVPTHAVKSPADLDGLAEL